MTDAFTTAARAEAERDWGTTVRAQRPAFIAGAVWARDHLAARMLPDPDGGCVCNAHEQGAGGGHVERLAEYEPACPEHSEHVYNPRTGIWDLSAKEAR